MHIDPIKKFVIIYGLHLDKVQNHMNEKRLIKLLEEKSFRISQDLTDLNIVVYKSADFSDYSKITHININLVNEISEIKFYTTKQY